MPYLIIGGLLLITLLFGILGIKSLYARDKANNEMIGRHLAIEWQDMKEPMPPATYGWSLLLLLLSFTSMIGLIISIALLT